MRRRAYAKVSTPEACVPIRPTRMRPVCIGHGQSGSSGKVKFVNRKIVLANFALAAAAITLISSAAGQRQRTAAPAATAGIASYLPASDAIAVIDTNRMLNETMPSILGGDPAKLAQANAEVDKFKAKTGVDVRSFDRVVMSSRYAYPAPGTTRLEVVAIAHGSFDAKAMAASVRTAANGKSREEKYRGANMTVIQVNDQIKLLGLWNMRLNELAVCVLDQNSLALGTPANVRAAIDAGKKGLAASDLIALATRDQNAVLGFGANISRELLAKLDVGNDTLAKDIGAIKQAYGSIGSAQTDVTMTIVARTDSAQSATNLGDTVEGLRQLGGIFITRMAQPRKALAESALNNLKVTTRGNELEIRTQVAAANLAALMK